MKRKNYSERPLPFETYVSIGIMSTVIRFDICETEDEELPWQCDECEFCHKEPLAEDDYSRLVSFLVRERFSGDDVEAIQLNYMESKTTEHKNEFAALKEWRAQVKEMAREVLRSLT